MPFYRFENFKSYRFNPHLSTADGPVIEGEFMYFRMVTKKAGTGADLHCWTPVSAYVASIMDRRAV